MFSVCVSFGVHLIAVMLIRCLNQIREMMEFPGGGGGSPLLETLCIVGDFDVVAGLLTSGQQNCSIKV